MVKKYSRLRNAVLSPGKFTWRQGACREAGAVILSSSPHLICMIAEKTLCQAKEQVSGKPLKVWWRLWNVTGPGHLRYFSLLIDFTLAFYQDCPKHYLSKPLFYCFPLVDASLVSSNRIALPQQENWQWIWSSTINQCSLCSSYFC